MKTILFADDEEILIDVANAVFEKLGYNVLTAKDGEGAVEIYARDFKNIDIVILDMVMPKMGAEEALRHMKNIDPDFKAILTTAYNLDQETVETLQQGFDSFIKKPFKLGGLAEVLNI